jgi:hypothetical protein
MKIYLIEFNRCDYDQYDSFVVIGKSEEDVVALLKKNHSREGPQVIDWAGGYTIHEIKPEEYAEAGKVLGSFNAG